MFSTPYRYLFMLLLAAYSFLNTLSVDAFDHYPIPVSRQAVAGLFLVITVGIWEGNLLLSRYLQKQSKSFLQTSLYQFAGSVLLTVIVTVLPALALLRWQGNLNADVLNLPMRLLLLVGFRVNLFLNILHIIFGYIQQLRQSQLEAEEYKKISAQAQLQAIRNQVNPHFLFNNLSVLSALIPKDTQASTEFLAKFSKVYRYVLTSHEKELVPLTAEMEFIQSYLYLLDKRFDNGLHITMTISPEASALYLVPVALQMLVENAVKHNAISDSEPLLVHIFDENGQTLVVRNTRHPRTDTGEPSTGLGLSNIVQRYRFLTPIAPEIIETPTHFTVKLPLLPLPGPAIAYARTNPGRRETIGRKAV
jgi:two-component system, LytTR family, sensor kinase